jgi:hypothetical protein
MTPREKRVVDAARIWFRGVSRFLLEGERFDNLEKGEKELYRAVEALLQKKARK